MTRLKLAFLLALVFAHSNGPAAATQAGDNWPSFRGVRASGVSTGGEIPAKWDVEKGENILWRTDIAGLGLSSPIIWGDKLFITTAVAEAGPAKLEAGLYGRIDAADDNGPQSWRLICLDKNTGKVLWDRELHHGKPASSATPRPATPTPRPRPTANASSPFSDPKACTASTSTAI